jgi:hypothetical protein
MTRSSEAYDPLTTAMDDLKPACLNDDRFTDDSTNAADVSAICKACPLYTLCRDFAQIDKPKAGIWAGVKYGSNSKKNKPK